MWGTPPPVWGAPPVWGTPQTLDPTLNPRAPPELPGPPRAMPRFGGVQGGSGLVLSVKTCGFRTIWNSLRMPREPREPRKWWQDPRLGPPIPHAPGARMTAVTQTPSNKECVEYIEYIYIYIYGLCGIYGIYIYIYGISNVCAEYVYIHYIYIYIWDIMNFCVRIIYMAYPDWKHCNDAAGKTW